MGLKDIRVVRPPARWIDELVKTAGFGVEYELLDAGGIKKLVKSIEEAYVLQWTATSWYDDDDMAQLSK